MANYGRIAGSAASGAAAGSVAGPYGAIIGGVVGLGAGIAGEVVADEAWRKRLKAMRDAKTYQGNANPYATQSVAENQYYGLAQESEKPNQQIELDASRATGNITNTGSSASGILAAISNVQANENEAKRKVAGDVYRLKDQRFASLADANQGVMEDQQAVFEDSKQKEAAIIKAQADKDANDQGQNQAGMDTAVGASMAVGSNLEGYKKRKKASAGNLPTYDYMSKSDSNIV